MRKKIEKKFWDMEIIGNRRKIYYSFVSLTSYLEHDSGCRCVCFQCGHNNGMTQTGVDAVIYLLIALGAKMRQNAAYVLQKEAVTMPIRQTGVASST